MSEEDVQEIIRSKRVVGSDGTSSRPTEQPARVSHPRFYGTFPRVLGRTSGTWAALAAPGRTDDRRRGGFVSTADCCGKVPADITLFDPQTIADRAYEDPHQYAAGIRMVIVNGTVVIGRAHRRVAGAGAAARARSHAALTGKSRHSTVLQCQ
jgi:N-acyl-D-aspartate/D-glutamate deacylase